MNTSNSATKSRVMANTVIDNLTPGTVIYSKDLGNMIFDLYTDSDKYDTHPSNPSDNYVRYGVRWALTTCKNQGMIKNIGYGIWEKV